MRARMSALAGAVGSAVGHRWRQLARTAGRTPGPFEGLDVVGKDGPHRTHLGPVQALPGEHAANVGLRRLELGGGLGNGK